MMISVTRASAWVAAMAIGMLLSACERPPVDTVQRGYRGTGMEQVYNPRAIAAQAAANAAPADSPMVPPGGPAAKTVFKNLQVVGDLGVGEFTRLMTSMTAWVSPDQGCAYCHKAGEDFSSDSLYTKVVARRMLQMTQHVNADWKPHVAQTGVTCYTCHRGKPVPDNVWFAPAAQKQAGSMLGQLGGAGFTAQRPVHSVSLAGERHPRHRQQRIADQQPQVHQTNRVDLRPDDAHVAVARRELHLLPQHTLFRRVGQQHAAAWHCLVRHSHDP
jgi:photosynthetic reaction center cytochrome c subunit